MSEAKIVKENLKAADGYFLVELNESDLSQLKMSIRKEFVRAKIINSQSELNNKWVGVGAGTAITISEKDNIYLIRDSAVLFEI